MLTELDKIATRFTIKDLENLSSIKAHTIRIWEKRYGILEPDRTDTNIRLYDIKNLTKLLNVTLLHNSGIKISKIARLSDNELNTSVKEMVSVGNGEEQYISALILSMLSFDQAQFEITYNKLTAETSFRNVFLNVFVPLLFKIGLQWQSDGILPVHEHFISNLIKQKLHINIERVQQMTPKTEERAYVLFLPMNEIHELGLLYIHYELSLKGLRSIFLGQSVPLENLKALQKSYSNISFIGYFTVQPGIENISSYLQKASEEILRDGSDELMVLGQNTRDLKTDAAWKNISVHKSIQDLLKKI